VSDFDYIPESPAPGEPIFVQGGPEPLRQDRLTIATYTEDLEAALQQTQAHLGVFTDAVASRTLAYVLILADPVTFNVNWYANEPWGNEVYGSQLSAALMPVLSQIWQAAQNNIPQGTMIADIHGGQGVPVDDHEEETDGHAE
jgi:hypothetical protein